MQSRTNNTMEILATIIKIKAYGVLSAIAIVEIERLLFLLHSDVRKIGIPYSSRHIQKKATSKLKVYSFKMMKNKNTLPILVICVLTLNLEGKIIHASG